MFLGIFRRFRDINLTLVVEWCPREDPAIHFADEGSHFDESSYSLYFDSFLSLVTFFSSLSLEIDCMAQEDKKCARYFSRFPDAKAEGRNFFAQKLDSSTCYYCFPPPSLIPASLMHFAKFWAHGLFLVPFWPSTPLKDAPFLTHF